MKVYFIGILLIANFLASNLDEENDYNLVDPQEEEHVEDGESPHLIPDINCLINNFHEFFGFPEKEVNGNITP